MPARTDEQRRAALAHANAIRSHRARIKHDLKHQRITIVDLLADPPPAVMTAKVSDLLTALPRWGAVKAHRVLQVARVSQTKTVAGLTTRQRQDLIAALQNHHQTRTTGDDG